MLNSVRTKASLVKEDEIEVARELHSATGIGHHMTVIPPTSQKTVEKSPRVESVPLIFHRTKRSRRIKDDLVIRTNAGEKPGVRTTRPLDIRTTCLQREASHDLILLVVP